MAKAVKLPALAENVESAVVLSVLVAEGDRVVVDQPLLELETEKATVELPSPFAGTVVRIQVRAGATVSEGETLLEIEQADIPSATPPTKPAAEEVTPVSPPFSAAAPAHVPEPVKPPPKREVVQVAAKSPSEPAGKAEAAKPGTKTAQAAPPPAAAEPREPLSAIPASPFVHRLARDLGVDLAQIQGTGEGGRITRHDVTAFARTQLQQPAQGPTGPKIPPLPDFSQWGEIEREPMSMVRRTIAEHMTTAWTSVPHVTQFDQADITDLEAARKEFSKRLPEGTGKLTVTSIALKVLASALKVFPKFNASVDMASGEIIHKKYVNLGVAVDTPRGLLVPVVHNADRMNIAEIIREVDRLSENARKGKSKLDELYGGTFTLTNLGGLGTLHFTPIVNWPEVAILGLGRARSTATWVGDGFAPRLIMPLSVSYDHRVIDGGDAARFLRWVCEALERPLLMALEG